MIEEKLKQLEAWFQAVPGTITAFSGGIDSSLVLYLSRKFLGDKGVGCISISPSLKRKDYALAIDFCKLYDIKLEIIETQEVKDENYLSNPSNRCYFCKSHLYTDISKLKLKYPEYIAVNGINKDDYKDYRPGIQAANEHGIQAPLAACGLTKADVREMAQYFGLPNWDKPASPCLSSRVPYGNFITPHKLKQIEEAETILNSYGFNDVRVRHYNTEARIEVPHEEIDQLQEHFDTIAVAIKALGFEKCTVDIEGFVSGKLNRVLQ